MRPGEDYGMRKPLARKHVAHAMEDFAIAVKVRKGHKKAAVSIQHSATPGLSRGLDHHTQMRVRPSRVGRVRAAGVRFSYAVFAADFSLRLTISTMRA